LRRANARVTLIDRQNHHLFQPLLYQVATAGLSPAEITAPIRSVLARQSNTEVMMDEVIGVDAQKREVLLTDRTVAFDFLILATGATHSYFGHDEWAQNARGLKSITDATSIRRDILMAFEAAEIEPDHDRRAALLTFVLVGAGPTGVEMAGAIAELSHRALASDFRHINPKSTRIILLEAGPRILNSFPPDLSQKAERMLEKMGVEVRVDTRVESIDSEGVVAAGARVPSKTVLWAAGVAASAAGRWLGAKTDSAGRVLVEPDLTAPGHPEIFVLGDTMSLTQEGRPLPGVAPVAMQQGKYAAEMVLARLNGKADLHPFRYLDKGNLATVGRAFAILDVHGIKLSGLLAWMGWLVIHILYLIGFRNRAVVLFSWAWAYVTYQRGARLITFSSDPDGDLAGFGVHPKADA
jgi:NADH dehydrogenase